MLLVFPSLLLGFAAYCSPGENGLLGIPDYFGNTSDVIQTANVSLKFPSGKVKLLKCLYKHPAFQTVRKKNNFCVRIRRLLNKLLTLKVTFL